MAPGIIQFTNQTWNFHPVFLSLKSIIYFRNMSTFTSIKGSRLYNFWIKSELGLLSCRFSIGLRTSYDLFKGLCPIYVPMKWKYTKYKRKFENHYPSETSTKCKIKIRSNNDLSWCSLIHSDMSLKFWK